MQMVEFCNRKKNQAEKNAKTATNKCKRQCLKMRSNVESCGVCGTRMVQF